MLVDGIISVFFTFERHPILRLAVLEASDPMSLHSVLNSAGALAGESPSRSQLAMVTCPCFTPHPTSCLHVRGLYLILVPPLRAAQVTTYFHNPCATEKFTKNVLPLSSSSTDNTKSSPAAVLTRIKGHCDSSVSHITRFYIHEAVRPGHCRYVPSDGSRVAFPALLTCLRQYKTTRYTSSFLDFRNEIQSTLHLNRESCSCPGSPALSVSRCFL